MKYSRGWDVQIGFIPYVEGWCNTGIYINEKSQMCISIDRIEHLIKLSNPFSFLEDSSQSVI